jgi:hypothetical protein
MSQVVTMVARERLKMSKASSVEESGSSCWLEASARRHESAKSPRALTVGAEGFAVAWEGGERAASVSA